MVCKQCGTENINASRFCVGCGAQLEGERERPAERAQAVQPPEIGYCGQPIVPKKSRRVWLIAGAAVLALVLVLLILALTSGSDGCEDVAEKFVVAYLTNDQQTLERVTEKSLYQYLRTNAQTARTVEECQAEAIRSEKCTEAEMDELRELYSYLGARGNFTNAHMVQVQYTTSAQGAQTEARAARVALSEINGVWYVVYIG